MKKTVIIALFLITLAGTGCTLFTEQAQVPAAPPAEVQLEKKVGLITVPDPLSVTTNTPPFVLQLENGDRIPVNSVNVNLKRYQKRRVQAEGKYSDDKKVFLIESVTSLGNETEVKQLYENADIGLKLQYPSIWDLKKNNNLTGIYTVTITPYEVTDADANTVDTITIERSENAKRLTPKQWLNLDDQYRSSDSFDTAIYQQSIVGPGQLDGVKRVSADGKKVEFYVSRDTFIYRLTHTTLNDADKDLYANAFFELVGSFEFVPFGKGITSVTAPPSSTPPPPAPGTPPSATPPQATPVAPTPAAVPAPAPPPAASSDAALATIRQSFVTYISAHISDFAAEPPASGSWSVTKLEFAAPEGKPEAFTGIYVTYQNGTDVRKILLEVKDPKAPEGMARIAYFKPGTVTDWSLADGADTAKGNEKTVVSTGAATSTNSSVVVKKGMTLLEAKSLKVTIQYPSSWYWSFSNKGYNFSDKPVSDTNVLIRLTEEAADPGTPDTLCTKKTNGIYCLKYNADQATLMQQMLDSLQE